MEKKFRVLVSDKISQKALETLQTNNIDFDYMPDCGTSDTLIEVIEPYAGLIIRSASKVSKEVIDRGKNLQVIGRAGIGVDNIDLKAASSKGIVVMNTPHGNAITTAEHTLAMIFAACRQIPAADQSTQNGKWEKSKFIGQELTGKTLGLIGVGNIGSIVADRALGLKLKVKAYDPFLTDEKVRGLGIERVKTLEKLVAESDIISLHIPKTDKTTNIINGSLIKKMKSTAILVNCARGGLIDEKALIDAIEDGIVDGAAIDVYEVEPAKESILFGNDKIICTPHLGASTLEAQENVAIQIAEQMSDYLIEGAVTNALNMPSISADEAPILGPFVKLSEQLGLFAGQLMLSNFNKIEIEYVGTISDFNCAPITSAAVSGILKPSLSDINMISAPSIAREKGITISEVKKDESSAYESYIKVTLRNKKDSFSIGGTVFSDGNPRIVQINGINLEAELNRNMLYVTNKDLPGLIGHLGSILGDEGINIASFNLGRNAPLKDAMALIGVDSEINSNVMKNVKKLESIVTVNNLIFNIK